MFITVELSIEPCGYSCFFVLSFDCFVEFVKLYCCWSRFWILGIRYLSEAVILEGYSHGGGFFDPQMSTGTWCMDGNIVSCLFLCWNNST